MRQLIQSYRTGELKVEDVPPPSVQPGGVLVRTVASLVSAGTERMIVDLARKSLLGKARARPDLVRKVVKAARQQGVANAIRKARTKLDTPIPLGYSCAGIVVETGELVHELNVGDRVACGGAGYANHADYNYVPRNLVARVPDGLSLETACFSTVGAIALQGVRQAQPTLGERIAVIGLGLVGQITVQLLRANGCRVLGFDPNPERAKLARELGAHTATSGDLQAEAERFSSGHGMDAVIVAASTSDSGPLEVGAEISRLRGRVVVVGLVGMEIPRSLFYRKELDLRMSMSYGPGRYDPDYEERGFDYPIAHVRWTEQRNLEAFLHLAADGSIRMEPLVTHRFDMDEALTAYSLLSGGSEPYLGVLLGYGADDLHPTTPPQQVLLRREAKQKGPVGVGLIGAGGFAQSVLLPALAEAGDSEPIIVASAGGMTARLVGERHGFRIATSSPDDVLSHSEVDSVFILTRHHLHATLAAEALRHGKMVFTEKPLALDERQLTDIEEARAQSNADVMVGFNRRFAPLVDTLAEHFRDRTSPLVMLYRINAGFIPYDHWVHDPVEGGGRILGEACHFVDLLQHLAGAKPLRVRAECISGGARYRSDDNVCAEIRLADGSVGSLVYTAMGSAELAKERLEVFGEGRSAVLDDFRTLDLYDRRGSRRHKSSNQDKGFVEEMRRFLASVRSGGPMPIAFDEAAATTRATFAIMKSLSTGQPQDV